MLTYIIYREKEFMRDEYPRRWIGPTAQQLRAMKLAEKQEWLKKMSGRKF